LFTGGYLYNVSLWLAWRWCILLISVVLCEVEGEEEIMEGDPVHCKVRACAAEVLAGLQQL
jgi:hypothetical protein